MAQDPWKRAHDISQLKQAGIQAPDDPPRLIRGRPAGRLSCGCVVAVILVAIVIGGGATLYFTRGWWLPRYRDQLPAPVVQAVQQVAPEPAADLDLHYLSSGLDVELRQFQEYGLFVGAMRERDVVLKVIATGGNSWRLSGEGVLVYVQDGLIWTYQLDLGVIFADERYRQWLPAFRHAGLTPDLTWTALTGETEMPSGHTEQSYRSESAARLPDGWAHSVYTLHFSDGFLRRIEAGINFGASSQAIPEQDG
jgi:hypothetical protein